MPDEELIEILAAKPEEIIHGEKQAYKRGVIRMVLRFMEERRAALDEIASIRQELED